MSKSSKMKSGDQNLPGACDSLKVAIRRFVARIANKQGRPAIIAAPTYSSIDTGAWVQLESQEDEAITIRLLLRVPRGNSKQATDTGMELIRYCERQHWEISHLQSFGKNEMPALLAQLHFNQRKVFMGSGTLRFNAKLFTIQVPVKSAP